MRPHAGSLAAMTLLMLTEAWGNNMLARLYSQPGDAEATSLRAATKIDLTQYSALGYVMTVTYVLSALLSGFGSDLTSRRAVIAAGGALCGLAVASYALCWSFGGLVASQLFLGSARARRLVAAAAIADPTTRSARRAGDLPRGDVAARASRSSPCCHRRARLAARERRGLRAQRAVAVAFACVAEPEPRRWRGRRGRQGGRRGRASRRGPRRRRRARRRRRRARAQLGAPRATRSSRRSSRRRAQHAGLHVGAYTGLFFKDAFPAEYDTYRCLALGEPEHRPRRDAAGGAVADAWEARQRDREARRRRAAALALAAVVRDGLLAELWPRGDVALPSTCSRTSPTAPRTPRSAWSCRRACAAPRWA